MAFFTTNYDTLIEDALALCRIRAWDGFTGGTVAFWDPERPGHGFDRPFSTEGGFQARVYKLHGSTDWCMSKEDVVVRRRESAGYPSDSAERLLIYPEATKYRATQRDPFASLFAAFRAALTDENPGVLAICGYSFGDDHINQEIERAMAQRSTGLTVLAFVHESEETGLPSDLHRWLVGPYPWKERVVVASNQGAYHGSKENLAPATGDAEYLW